jgi:hypothetical protein
MRIHKDVLFFFQAYKEGRIRYKSAHGVVANKINFEPAPLITDPNRPLRGQFPRYGKYFKLDLSLSTAWIYIEKDRKKKWRDKQIANVWDILTDPEGKTEIDELMRLIATHGKRAGEAPERIDFLFSLKLLWRGSVGANDTFKVVSLGLDSPWMDPGVPRKTFRGVICHELGHVLQGKLYGWKPSVGFLDRFEGLRHNPWVTTNSSLSLSEGFGDYCGKSFGKGDYWEFRESFRRKDGKMDQPVKSRKDLLRTEGVVTQILVLSEERIPGFRDKLFASMKRHRPTSIQALIRGYGVDNSGEKALLEAVREEVLKGAH